jgi:23S rRNA pseudouridine2605 synthase
MLERLQKILARAGFGGRLRCEELLLRGAVVVNGRVVRELGASADPDADRIEVVGERIRLPETVYYLLNKPADVVCTALDPQRRTRAVDLVPGGDARLFAVGRLDLESTGLLLLTNDGALAQRLSHPRFGAESTYRIEIDGPADHALIESLRRGVFLAEGKAAIRRGRVVFSSRGRSTVEIVLQDRKNREVRRMLAKMGRKVRRLTRIRLGPLGLGGLKPGQWREPTPEEMEQLRAAGSAGDGTERTRG